MCTSTVREAVLYCKCWVYTMIKSYFIWYFKLTGSLTRSLTNISALRFLLCHHLLLLTQQHANIGFVIYKSALEKIMKCIKVIAHLFLFFKEQKVSIHTTLSLLCLSITNLSQMAQAEPPCTFIRLFFFFFTNNHGQSHQTITSPDGIHQMFMITENTKCFPISASLANKKKGERERERRG